VLEYAEGVVPTEIKAASRLAASFAASLAILESRSPR